MDCVDRSLQDITKVDKRFSGISTVFSGDPRQILPVVHHGNQEYLVDTMAELIDRVFPDIEEECSDKYWVARRAILTSRNENVDKINESIMAKFPGEGKTYLSADTVGEDDLHSAYPIDFLNSITLSCMLPHTMTLKVGAPVILLRNLRGGSRGGLRNGT